MKRSDSARHLPDCIVRDSIRRLGCRDSSFTNVDLPLRNRRDLLETLEAMPGNDHVLSLRISFPEPLDDRETVLMNNDMEKLANTVCDLAALKELAWNESHCNEGFQRFLEAVRLHPAGGKIETMEINSPCMSYGAANELTRIVEQLKQLKLRSIAQGPLNVILLGAHHSPSLVGLHLTEVLSKSDDVCNTVAAIIYRNRIRDLTFILKTGNPREAASRIGACQRALHYNTSIESLKSNCLCQETKGIEERFCSHVRSVTLVNFPSMGKPASALIRSPRLNEIILDGNSISIHNLQKIPSLLCRCSAPIRRFVLRRALLARDLQSQGLACNRVYNFLISLVMLPDLEHLTIGSIGDDFISCLANVIHKFTKLKSLTLFVYRASSIEPLTRQLQKVNTNLLEINIWPSNPNRRLLPPAGQLCELQQTLFRNRMQNVNAESILQLHDQEGTDEDKIDTDENEADDDGDVKMKNGSDTDDINAAPLALWPHVLFKLGRFSSYNPEGEPTSNHCWHDVSYALLSGRPDVLQR